MKLIKALLIASLIIPSIVWSTDNSSKLRYNWVEKKWNYAPKSAKLQFNWMENQYEFVVPNSQLKLNIQSNNYEYVQTQISSPYQSEIDQ